MISEKLFLRQIARSIQWVRQPVAVEIVPSPVRGFQDRSVSGKFRDMANGLTSLIEQKTAPLHQNWTPKRGREHAARVHDGNNLQRCQQALYALADAWEAGLIPLGLQTVKTKSEVLKYCETKSDNSNGYYTHVELHDQYKVNTETARQLREFCGIGVSQEQQKRSKLDLLLNDLRINPPPGFFPTPRPVIDLMIEQVADKLQADDVRVLEPSAGIGSIIDVVTEVAPHACIHAVEMNDRCREVLVQKGFASGIDAARATFGNVWSPAARLLERERDFSEYSVSPYYDVILMNPPFEHRQDEQHVRIAYGCLRSGGRLVAIVSAGAIQNQRSASFVDWLDSMNASWEALPEGSFNTVESFRRTGVQCYMVTIDKE